MHVAPLGSCYLAARCAAARAAIVPALAPASCLLFLRLPAPFLHSLARHHTLVPISRACAPRRAPLPAHYCTHPTPRHPSLHTHTVPHTTPHTHTHHCTPPHTLLPHTLHTPTTPHTAPHLVPHTFHYSYSPFSSSLFLQWICEKRREEERERRRELSHII